MARGPAIRPRKPYLSYSLAATAWRVTRKLHTSFFELFKIELTNNPVDL
jgi:hypothetical protein